MQVCTIGLFMGGRESEVVSGVPSFLCNAPCCCHVYVSYSAQCMFIDNLVFKIASGSVHEVCSMV